MSATRMIGQYEVLGLLGEGGTGQVYSARDTVLGREVAIKSLRPELLSDSSFVERFRAEAANLASLNHPNITTLYTLLADEKQLYMVMELVRGHTLEAVLLERQEAISPHEAVAIISQVVDGLSYAHAVGIVHRDIKPANLMITGSGQLKIMDFSIARVQGSQRLTRDGSIIGTLAYMAPEQLRAEEVDARTDLYSLAIVMYEMLSGSVPFTATSDYELMRAQIHNAPARLKNRVAGLDPQIEKALMRALSKKPSDRYSSVAAFGEAIGASKTRIDAEQVTRQLAQATTKTIQAPGKTVSHSEIGITGPVPILRGFAVGTAAIAVAGTLALAAKLVVDFAPAMFANQDLPKDMPSFPKTIESDLPDPIATNSAPPATVPMIPASAPTSLGDSSSVSRKPNDEPSQKPIDEPSQKPNDEPRRLAIAPEDANPPAEKLTSKPPVGSAPEHNSEEASPPKPGRHEHAHAVQRSKDVSPPAKRETTENRGPSGPQIFHGMQ
jgi:serine/threonine protein kinase